MKLYYVFEFFNRKRDVTVTVIVTFLNQVFFSMDGEKRNVEHFYERSLNVTVTVTFSVKNQRFTVQNIEKRVKSRP